MDRFEFKAARIRLGLTQKQLAEVLGYDNVLSISALERTANWRVCPYRLGLLMEAMLQGYRPENWPGAGSRRNLSVQGKAIINGPVPREP